MSKRSNVQAVNRLRSNVQRSNDQRLNDQESKILINNIFNSSGGLLPTNGETWRNLRMPAQKPMLNEAQFSQQFIKIIDKASLDFVESLKSKIVWTDILEELKKHFLEITTLVVLGTSLKTLENHPEALRLIQSAMDTNR